MAYRTEGGRYPIREWYESEDEAVQADFDAILTVLRDTRNWYGRKDIHELTRRHKGLWEIRFAIDRVRYRPVGFMLPALDQSRFILLLGCKKPERGSYIPQDAFDQALELRRLFLDEGRGTVHEHIF